MLNRTGPSIDPWGRLLVNWLPSGRGSTDHHPPGPDIQPVFNLPHSTVTQPIPHQLCYKDLTGDGVKGLNEVQLDNKVQMSKDS